MPTLHDDASADAPLPRWPRIVATAVAVAVLGAVVVRAVPGDAERALIRALGEARTFADSVERAADDRSVRRAVLVGYLDRQRDGLGSPFRLIDLARLDPRLTPFERERLALALLARTGAVAPLPPAAPGALAIAAASGAPAQGARLAATIEALVLDDPSVETLETIRIAALIAGAEGHLQPRAVPLVGATAVLVRDRLRARADAAAILATAAAGTGDALGVASAWRASRRLASERPSLSDPAPDPRRVATRIRTVAARLAAAASAAGGAPAAGEVAASAPVARPAAPIAVRPRRDDTARARPPQPPVRLALQDAQALIRAIGRDDGADGVRALLTASDEEALAAALPGARAMPRDRAAADVAVLLAAQGMRILAQETAWHPGVALPAPATVAAQLGLASLRFGTDVPRAWRPWYARELAHAVSSLRTVFPFASVAGLHVRIGGRVGPDALAVHDPRSRTLVVPIETGFGALGHELLHDIDWQAARDQLKRRGSYATDAAVRGAPRDSVPLAAPLMRLAALAAPPSVAGPLPAPTATDQRRMLEAQRPAELLARGGDWYVAATLARAGRSDGALTSVQDAWVPGYASAALPDAVGAREAALAALLDAMPALARRETPAGGATTADLGALARLAWRLPLPDGPIDAALRPPVEVPVTPDGLHVWARDRSTGCSPLAQARVRPVRPEAVALVDAVLRPRVAAGLRRWAARPAPADEAVPAQRLRAALLGAPIDGDAIARAEDLGVLAARRALPCLADAAAVPEGRVARR